MFPEDYFIEKHSLIWRWVVEGLVPDREGIGSFELGEVYFNMLVNKSMIRWMEPNEDAKTEGGCRVHDMVFDLIRTISDGVNFVTVDGMEQHNTCLRGKQTSKVRRLAVHGSSARHNCSIEMGHISSFNVIMCGHTKMPLLLSFKVLCVLVIVECVFLEGHGLEHLGKLVQLRYLGLVKTVVKLPEGIGYDLKYLEILDVRGGSISELPPSVSEQKNLRCLWADEGTMMKGEIGKLTCLEKLRLFSVDMCPNFFTDLRKLTKLRVLEIYFDQVGESTGKVLAESLCNLQKIQRLRIFRSEVKEIVDLHKGELHERGGVLEDMAPSSRLHLLQIENIIIPRMPSWIDSLCVPCLSDLRLYVEVVEARDLQTLGRLPSLLFLVLLSEEEKCISYTFGSDEFRKLTRLKTNIEITLGEGALPMLELLAYSASAGRKESLVPWNNSCPLLEYVFCQLDCTNSGRMEVKAAKSVLRKADTNHPNAEDLNLHIYLKRYNRKAARLVDALSSIQLGSGRPDGEEITADQRDIHRVIFSLQTLLHDAAEPRLGGYGGQELRGIVTKLKSWLHDHAGADQEETDDSDATDISEDEDYTDNDDDDDDVLLCADIFSDSDGDNHTGQQEADNDVATGSKEGRATQP